MGFQVYKHRMKQLQLRILACPVSCTSPETLLCRCKPVRSIRKRTALPTVMDQFSLGCPSGSTKSHMQRVEVVRPRVRHFCMRCLLVILVHVFMPKENLQSMNIIFFFFLNFNCKYSPNCSILFIKNRRRTKVLF